MRQLTIQGRVSILIHDQRGPLKTNKNTYIFKFDTER